MRKKRYITIGGIIVLLIAACAAVFSVWQHENSRNTAQSASRAPAFTEANASWLAQSLSSSNRIVQAKALAPQLRSGGWDASALLPSGAILAIDPASLTTDSNSYGYANATVSGSVTATFVLTLAYSEGQWRLVTTTQK